MAMDFDDVPDIVAVAPSEFCSVFYHGDGTPPGGWTNFIPADWTNDLTPDCRVHVSDQGGLRINSAQYYYTTNGGGLWHGPFQPVCTAREGSTSATLIAIGVPFNQESRSANRIKFSIQDLNGNIGNSPVYYVKTDITLPTNPSIVNTHAHRVEEWCRFNRINVTWNMGSDVISGIGGYSYSFTQSAASIPDAIPDTGYEPRSIESPILSDGKSWYFHLRAVDKAGNAAAETLHFGPFWIDATPPPPPTINLYSNEYKTSTWLSSNYAVVKVTLMDDNLSGNQCIRYNYTLMPDSIPVTGTETILYSYVKSENLGDGNTWYCHAQTKDVAGNYSEAAHFGPFWIDKTPPRGSLRISSIAGTGKFNVKVIAEDTLSGVRDWDIVYREFGESDNYPHNYVSHSTSTDIIFTPPDPTKGYELGLALVDNCGNESSVLGPFPARAGTPIEVIVREEIDSGGVVSYPIRANAKVFRNNEYIGKTNASGRITVPDVFLSDRLYVLYMKQEFPTVRPFHNTGGVPAWQRRHYISNVVVNDDGTVAPHVVSSLAGPIMITMRKQNTVIGFNIVVSLEWDAGERYLEHLREGYRLAGDFLYASTDGQMFFENVEIRDNKNQWLGADIRMYQGYRWPSAGIGGIDSANVERKIHLPRFFDGRNCHVGPYTNLIGYNTIIHEFGHYGLALFDEYFIRNEETEEENAASCTMEQFVPGSKYALHSAYSASVMDNVMPNFCDILAANPHNHRTEQHRQYGMSCWEWLKKRYADKMATPRWTLISPADRGDQVPGPDSLPCKGWCTVEILNDSDTGAHDAIYRFLTVWDTPDRNCDVTLLTRSGITAYMGRTDSNGEVMMYGVHKYDQAMLQHGDSFRIVTIQDPTGRKVQKGDRRNEMAENPKQTLKATTQEIVAPPNPYTVRVSAIPGATTDTLHIAVSTTTTLAEPPQVLVWIEDSLLPQPIMPVMAWDAKTSRYEGTVIMDVATDPEGMIVAQTIDIDALESVGAARFNFIFPPKGKELDWGGAEAPLGLHMKAESYPPGATLAFELTGRPDAGDRNLSLVKGPFRLYSNNGEELRGKANLSMSYAMDLDEAYRTTVSEMSLYQWDEKSGKWEKLKSTHFPEWNRVSAPISSMGIFMLAAPPLATETTGIISY